MDYSGTDFAAYGLSSPESRQVQRDTGSKTATNPLVDHAAVTGYRALGVSTEDLTSFIESFASLRATRVKGVGHEQYSHAKGQKFESFTTSDTIRELIEELADASNYIDFLAIKLLNIQHTIDLVLPDCD
tara:strand:- start:329 stop:718 length:390 start_codon:yes stop_codon:yes gene_type:complete